MSDVIPIKRAPSGTRLRIGFLRLTDSAPVIVADAFGWFAEEGLDVELLEEPSWANIADKLAYGFLDAAIVTPPLAFAIELGLRGVAQRLIIPAGISLGGNTVTVSQKLGAVIQARARTEGSRDAFAAEIKSLAAPPSFGIVHAYSTHNLLLRYWLASAGLIAGEHYRLSVVSPSRAVEALQAGQIAGFCAGAPWGEIAAREGVGLSIATSDDIWTNAPEKAFAMRASWAEDHPAALQGALRALARAAQFCDAPENASYTGALLSRHRYLNVDSHAILSSLPGGAVMPRNVSRFWRNAATFPWASHGAWFLEQMARWNLIDNRTERAALVARVYRPDLYRAALAPAGVDLPMADSKPEGAHAESWLLDAKPNPIPMGADRFCDGAIFKAAATEAAH